MARTAMFYLRYDPIAVTLHWVIAVSIMVMIPLGLYMDVLPPSVRFLAYDFHKSLGITVLGLSIFRLVWRFLNPPPPLPASVTRTERLLAHAAHWGLYFLMLAMPLTGWLMVSASQKYPTVFFGIGEVPFIPMPEGIDGKATAHLLRGYHLYLAYGAIALIAGHASAALKHHFVKKDTVLLRMWPRFLSR